MSASSYKSSKEAFVSGMTGSSVTHVNTISLVALVGVHEFHVESSDRLSLSRFLLLFIPLCALGYIYQELYRFLWPG